MWIQNLWVHVEIKILKHQGKGKHKCNKNKYNVGKAEKDKIRMNTCLLYLFQKWQQQGKGNWRIIQ